MLRPVVLFVVLLAAPVGAQEVPDWAVAVFPSGAEFTLEIAATDRERQLGYMFREKVPAHEGMLFIFDETDLHGIWMKNCRVPLDIIWLDEDFRVLAIAPQAQPCPAQGSCPSMRPLHASRFVLEIAAGRAAEEELVPGDLLIVHSEPAL
jgi:uncharacterized membrane protein (UPF0127 family)